MAILAVNAGSSSLKFSLHEPGVSPQRTGLLSGQAEGLEPGGHARMRWSAAGRPCEVDLQAGAAPSDARQGFARALTQLGQLLHDPAMPALQAIAHRVVHGGLLYRSPVRVDDKVLRGLTGLCSLAPLHQPHNIAGIKACLAAFPQVPQVACFDTAFHASLPETAWSYALPEELTRQGLRRFGFHGLSYEFIMQQLQQLSSRAGQRVLMAHLGNGASLCAALEGRSQATTMGFSALDGLMMGTRSGSIDPGILLYLLEQGWDHARIEDLLYRRSGLLGVSGLSADMRRLRAADTAAARNAIAQFTYRVIREAGAMTACLGGLEVLAFSGGIGEHDALLRAEVGTSLAYLGVRLDPQANAAAQDQSARAIHSADSRVEVWVIPTDEGSIAAQQAAALLAAAAG